MVTIKMEKVYAFIDDGVPDRGHRTNFFNEDFLTMGSYSGYHK